MGDFYLEEYKRIILADVKRKTEELFLVGFTFGGVRVRMNTRSLIFYQSLNDLGIALTTTIIPAADDLLPPLTINLGNIGAFLGATKAYLRQLYQDEAALIGAIRLAVDRQGVDAVQDLRQPS